MTGRVEKVEARRVKTKKNTNTKGRKRKKRRKNGDFKERTSSVEETSGGFG